MTRHELAMQKLAEGTIIPATPLALNADGSFNEKGLRLLMNYYLNCGVGGIATAVHSTQFEIRDPKINLLESVLKTVSEEIDRFEAENDTIIVKVGGVCGPVEQAVSEAELAKKYGYDAVLLSPGGLSHLSEEGLINRTRAVAEIMPVIGFYLQTAVGGRVFSYDYWEKLCAIENVVAIKCACFNRYGTLDVVRAAALSPRCKDITLYTGNDDNIVIDLLTKYSINDNGWVIERGFDGGLLGHWSVWTLKAVELFNKIKAAKKQNEIPAELMTLAAQITDANGAFFDTANGFKGCIAGLHEVLHRQGLMENTLCLNPDERLSNGQAAEIDRVYKAYPHLCDDEFIKENLSVWKSRMEV